MLEALAGAPVIRVLTGIVAAFLGLSQLSALVGLAPFWSDVLAGTVLMAMAWSLYREGAAAGRGEGRAGFHVRRGIAVTTSVGVAFVAAFVFAVIAVSVVARPVLHLASGPNHVCVFLLVRREFVMPSPFAIFANCLATRLASRVTIGPIRRPYSCNET